MGLTDEQIDLLYQNQKVVDARRAFLSKLTEGFCKKDEALIAEGNVLKAKYEKIFAEHLKWVLENPPEPKAQAVISHNGFARRV